MSTVVEEAVCHVLLFRLAVPRSSDLFKGSAGFPRETVLELARWVRSEEPPRRAKNPLRRFGVTSRLLTLEEVGTPEARLHQAQVFQEALRESRAEVTVATSFFTASVEAHSDFIVWPAWRRCYTLLWRFLSVWEAPGAGAEDRVFSAGACNRLLACLRSGLRLSPDVFLDVYPKWITPASAGAVLEREKERIRRQKPGYFRMPAWEGGS